MTRNETTLSHAGFSGSEQHPARLLRAIRAHRLYLATLRHLRALTDKQLNDIGFRRDDLKSIARAAVHAH